MNFLAHAYLSFEDHEILIGNIIGDFVKGNNYKNLPTQVQNGIILHRKIDTFTDKHEYFKKSVFRINDDFGKYRFVIADLFYDHLLSKYWKKYHEVAYYYGFFCIGCEYNFFYTSFYHHTLLEYLFIMKGNSALEHEIRNQVAERALEVCAKTIEYEKTGKTVRLLCPLNFGGLCILYDYRPMICRLHGIPHELQKAGHSVMYSPGCEAFTKQIKSNEYYKFDRTPFYIKMAELENELKKAAGITRKLKMTVAEMSTRLNSSHVALTCMPSSD